LKVRITQGKLPERSMILQTISLSSKEWPSSPEGHECLSGAQEVVGHTLVDVLDHVPEEGYFPTWGIARKGRRERFGRVMVSEYLTW
jgi:hypothetical protein